MKCGRIVRADGRGVPQVWRADTVWLRLRGLLGRPRLAADGSQALLIVPCSSIHTFGMRYPLDVVFLDRAWRVLGWRERLGPWRAALCRGAAMTLELHAGALRRLRPRLGEPWPWTAGDGDGSGSGSGEANNGGGGG